MVGTRTWVSENISLWNIRFNSIVFLSACFIMRASYKIYILLSWLLHSTSVSSVCVEHTSGLDKEPVKHNLESPLPPPRHSPFHDDSVYFKKQCKLVWRGSISEKDGYMRARIGQVYYTRPLLEDLVLEVTSEGLLRYTYKGESMYILIYSDKVNRKKILSKFTDFENATRLYRSLRPMSWLAYGPEESAMPLTLGLDYRGCLTPALQANTDPVYDVKGNLFLGSSAFGASHTETLGLFRDSYGRFVRRPRSDHAVYLSISLTSIDNSLVPRISFKTDPNTCNPYYYDSDNSILVVQHEGILYDLGIEAQGRVKRYAYARPTLAIYPEHGLSCMYYPTLPSQPPRLMSFSRHSGYFTDRNDMMRFSFKNGKALFSIRPDTVVFDEEDLSLSYPTLFRYDLDTRYWVAINDRWRFEEYTLIFDRDHELSFFIPGTESFYMDMMDDNVLHYGTIVNGMKLVPFNSVEMVFVNPDDRKQYLAFDLSHERIPAILGFKWSHSDGWHTTFLASTVGSVQKLLYINDSWVFCIPKTIFRSPTRE
jgi:hypothetical protein